MMAVALHPVDDRKEHNAPRGKHYGFEWSVDHEEVDKRRTPCCTEQHDNSKERHAHKMRHAHDGTHFFPPCETLKAKGLFRP